MCKGGEALPVKVGRRDTNRPGSFISKNRIWIFPYRHSKKISPLANTIRFHITLLYVTVDPVTSGSCVINLALNHAQKPIRVSGNESPQDYISALLRRECKD